MIFHNQNDLKYKLLSLDELIINLDRLTRFKIPEDSYNRVFRSILFNNLVYPKFSKSEIEKLSTKYISNYVKTIWNASVKKNLPNNYNNTEINKLINFLIKTQYKNIDESTKELVNTKLIISPILSKIDTFNAPINLKFLIWANNKFSSKNPVDKANVVKYRKKHLLKFPIKKLLIVEGITEEILLPVFAKKLGYDFDSEGIHIIGAGGKSKSPDLYLKLKDKLKIPIIILFDSDADVICHKMKNSLSKNDKTIIIDKGEFEDIISLNLIKRTLNNEYSDCIPVSKKDLKISNHMCSNIENYYKTRKLGEFKKSKFSKLIAKNVKYKTDITKEIEELVNKIVN